MSIAAKVNAEQVELWNGTAGRAWVDVQAVLEQMFEPFTTMLVAAVRADSASRVLDIGCGTGATTRAIARALGDTGVCVGVDISAPMIAAARCSAERERCSASFLEVDAQAHDFAAASFDMIVSRFGVMFFDDSTAAFTNLRRATRQGGSLRFIAWRSAAENPFMTTAERAAAPLLPSMPMRQPDAPGQFAFASKDRIRDILEGSGWDSLEIHAIDVTCTFPMAKLELYLTRLGPLGRVLHEIDATVRERIIPRVRAAFDDYVHGHEVRFDAACWLVGARASNDYVSD